MANSDRVLAVAEAIDAYGSEPLRNLMENLTAGGATSVSGGSFTPGRERRMLPGLVQALQRDLNDEVQAALIASGYTLSYAPSQVEISGHGIKLASADLYYALLGLLEEAPYLKRDGEAYSDELDRAIGNYLHGITRANQLSA